MNPLSGHGLARYDLAKWHPKDLIPAQVRLFRDSDLLRVSVGLAGLESTGILTALQAAEGQPAIALSVGGTHLLRADVVVSGSMITIQHLTTLAHGAQGRDYLHQIEVVASEVAQRSLPIGIAVAGIVMNRKIQVAANLGAFMQDLSDSYGGELTRLFPGAVIAMDDVFGTLAAVLVARHRHPAVTSVVSCTVGSGIGGAVYTEDASHVGTIYAIEPGHVEAVPDLIPVRGYQRPCGVDGATLTCVENVASGIGIAALYEAETHHQVSGEQLNQLAKEGEKTSVRLYANSAHLVAHAIIVPAREIFGKFRQPESTAVVFEGGVHNVPGYTTLLMNTLTHNLGFQPPTVYPHDIPANASLVGAALAAFLPRQE